MKPITTAGDPSKFKEPPKEITIKNKPLSSKAKMRMKNTQEKIRSIGKVKDLRLQRLKPPTELMSRFFCLTQKSL